MYYICIELLEAMYILAIRICMHTHIYMPAHTRMHRNTYLCTHNHAHLCHMHACAVHTHAHLINHL